MHELSSLIQALATFHKASETGHVEHMLNLRDDT